MSESVYESVDYQDILTLWTSVLHNLLSECRNVGLFMVGLTRFDCISNCYMRRILYQTVIGEGYYIKLL